MTTHQNIAIVGSGNVANFLAVQFFSKQFNIEQIISRNAITGQHLANKVNATFSQFYELQENIDLVLICVPDNQIKACADAIKVTKAIVCHCAGSIGIDALNRFDKYGVLYPLQTLSDKFNSIDLEIPFLIEANSIETLNKLKYTLELMKYVYSEVNSDKRILYHLAAVFVNNFTNAMVLTASEIAEKQQLDFSLLKPLLFQTFEKLKIASPFDNQTGPAKRNDVITIQKHLALLEDNVVLSEIYQSISRYITLKFKPSESVKED